MSETNLLNEVITGYRKIIEDRYQFDAIDKIVEIPIQFDQSFIQETRDYYLNYIYPNIEKREELNEAFESLDNYLKKPDKLLQILLDSTSLIFKYGIHLPKILNAGLGALKSFRTANSFEGKLVEEATKNQVEPPFDKKEIHSLIRQLSREDIDSFIENSQSLFETLHDKKLVRKMIEIISYLITKMETKPDTYSNAEIRGFQIGKELIEQGNKLFNQLPTKEDQQELIQLIVDIERAALDEIYG